MIGRSASMEEGRARLLAADAALTDAILTGVIMPTPTSSSLGFPQCAQHGSTATAHNGGGGGMVGSSVDCSHSISVVWRSGGAALTAAAAACAAETGQRGTQSTRSRVVCSLRLPSPRLAVFYSPSSSSTLLAPLLLSLLLFYSPCSSSTLLAPLLLSLLLFYSPCSSSTLLAPLLLSLLLFYSPCSSSTLLAALLLSLLLFYSPCSSSTLLAPLLLSLLLFYSHCSSSTLIAPLLLSLLLFYSPYSSSNLLAPPGLSLVCESRMPAVADRVVLRKLAQDIHNAHFFSAPISPPPSLTPLPQPSPPPLSLTPLPQPSPPHLSPISLPHPLAPTASTHPSPLPAFPHLSPTLRTPHPYPSLPRLSPNTSLNLFPKPLPQTSRPTRSPTPFPPRLPPVPPLHASFQHLPLSRLGHTPLPHRLPPPCPDPAGRSQLARRQWDPVASASQSSPHLHIPHLHLFHGPATRFLSFMPSCGCVVRRGGEWGEDKAVPGLFSRRKAKMTTIITSPSGHLAFSLAGSVLRLL
ncbi:unnamed protein product [Closterium sp. NIES-65]|nr:unnamed protein product [Closterium sp. NIES-65]